MEASIITFLSTGLIFPINHKLLDPSLYLYCCTLNFHGCGYFYASSAPFFCPSCLLYSLSGEPVAYSQLRFSGSSYEPSPVSVYSSIHKTICSHHPNRILLLGANAHRHLVDRWDPYFPVPKHTDSIRADTSCRARLSQTRITIPHCLQHHTPY